MDPFFDGWRPRVDELTVSSDWRPHCPYEPQSPPLVLPSAAAGAAPAPLSLWRAAAVAGAADQVAAAGGPVWALDWCPAPDAGSGDEFLAVGCHPKGRARNRIGEPVLGPSVLQLWRVPTPPPPDAGAAAATAAAAAPAGLATPALALAHEAGLAWSCRWCPDASLADDGGEPGTLPRLGLLAAALGDGGVRVWAVPRPSPELAALAGGADAAAPPVVTAAPAAVVPAAALGGSMAATVDWLPSAPHDLLLVGCWDGVVAVLKLCPPAAGGGASAAGGALLLARFPADPLALRAARWAPPPAALPAPGAPAAPHDGGAHRHALLTAGHEGALKVWDWRDPGAPLYCHQLTAATLLDAAWVADPLGAAAGVEDGSLKCCPMPARPAPGAARDKPQASFSFRGAGMGATWAVAPHPSGAVAYAGEDGVLALGAGDLMSADRRRRQPHPALGAARAAGGGALALLTAAQAAAEGPGLYTGAYVDRMAGLAALRGEVPPAAVAVHRLAWSRGAAAGGGSWLAAGTAAGLVRLVWVRGG